MSVMSIGNSCVAERRRSWDFRLPAGLAACAEGLRRTNAFGWDRKEGQQIDRQGGGEAFDHIHGRIVITTLDAADRRAIEIGVNCQTLLRDRLCSSYLPKIPCKSRPSVHAAHATNLRPSNPSDISDIL